MYHSVRYYIVQLVRIADDAKKFTDLTDVTDQTDLINLTDLTELIDLADLNLKSILNENKNN